MSSASVTSSKRKVALIRAELVQELEAVGRLVTTLQEYLDSLRTLTQHLKKVNENCAEMKKINMQWIDIANTENK